MKRLFDVLVEKPKEVDAIYVSLGIGLFALITLISVTTIINNIIKMIVSIAEIIAGNPVALG